MRIFALTYGEAQEPSSLYRICQYVAPLKQRGIDIETCPVKKFDFERDLSEFDAVILQKKLLVRHKRKWIRERSRRLVFDIDEAVWHSHHNRSHHWLTNLRVSQRLKALARSADLCVAANRILAAHLRRWTSSVIVLPTALDEELWPQKNPSPPHQVPVRVGWTDRASSSHELESIEPALASVHKKCPEAEFVICSGEQPKFQQLQYRFVPYHADREVEAVRQFDIGLLPLKPGPFADSHSPIKALQYMAAGIPVVLSPLCAAREMFSEGETALFARSEEEWTRSILQLVRNPDLRIEMGNRARKHFEENYSLSNTAPRFAEILCSL
jgi:glycosyltransferase involved in cell wall biosynthesis